MDAKQFIRETNKLFSADYLNSLSTESPYEASSRQLDRKVKSYLKSILPEAKIFGFKGGFCCTSGFVEMNGKFVYISIPDIRFNRNWQNNILMRIAKNEHDYTGGWNDYTTIERLSTDIMKLIK